MVLAVIFAGFFNRPECRWVLRPRRSFPGAVGVVAVVAGIPIRKIVAAGAVADFFFDIQDGPAQAFRILPRAAQHAVGQSLRAFRADAREACGIRRSVSRSAPRSRSWVYFFGLYGSREDVKKGLYDRLAFCLFQKIVFVGDCAPASPCRIPIWLCAGSPRTTATLLPEDP